jgi:hypothetical protein
MTVSLIALPLKAHPNDADYSPFSRKVSNGLNLLQGVRTPEQPGLKLEENAAEGKRKRAF